MFRRSSNCATEHTLKSEELFSTYLTKYTQFFARSAVSGRGVRFYPKIRTDTFWSAHLYGQDWHTNSDVEGILNSESDLDDDRDDGDEHPVNSW